MEDKNLQGQQAWYVRFGSRVWKVITDRIFDAVIGFLFVGLAGWFGFAKFFSPEKKSETNNAVATSTELGQEPEASQKIAKPRSNEPIVAAGNVGYRREKSNIIFTKLKILEEGPQEPPFAELISGSHSIPFEAHVTIKDDRLISYIGYGNKTEDYLVEGELTASFNQTSLLALLKDEKEETFLKDQILPIIRETAQSNLMKAIVEAQIEAEKKQAEQIGQAEAIEIADLDKIADNNLPAEVCTKLTALMEAPIALGFDGTLALSNTSINISKIRRLSSVEVEADAVKSFENIEAPTLVRNVLKTAPFSSIGGGVYVSSISSALIIVPLIFALIFFALVIFR